MEYLGGRNLFISHFIIGTREVDREYTQTETNEIRALQKWLSFKDTDWGMKRYRTERTQFINFLYIIDINTMKQLLNELVATYKKQFPYSTKSDFIEHVFSYSLFDLKQFIEREYTWLSEAPGEPDFTFYTYFCDDFKEFLDFAIPTDHSIEHYKQYYRKVIDLIENLDFESALQPQLEKNEQTRIEQPNSAQQNYLDAENHLPVLTKELKDKYKEYFGVERPSALYENLERIEWIVSEADAERINTRYGKGTVKVGEKGTQLPPPETNEKAWERLVNIKAQRIFENLKIKLHENYSEPESKEVLQAHIDKINQFISEAENSNLIEAIEKPDFQSRKQEYLRIKHKFYIKNFCGSKDGWFIHGRTPNESLVANIYGEYFLFKNWLEQLLTEQITAKVGDDEQNQSPATVKKAEPEPATPQPIILEQNRTKKVVAKQFKLLDKRGWEYAFRNETDYNTFADLLTNFFEFKEYSLPKQAIQLKKGCKTRLAATLGKIHSELSNNDTLSGDNEFFEIVKVLNHFSELSKTQLYKDLSRHGKD